MPVRSALAALLVLAAPAALAQGPALDALAAKAAVSGTVRVLVGVAGDVVPEGRLAPSAARRQRAEIEARQGSVLAALAAPSAVRRFEIVPYVAMTVSADDLARLRRSPWVTSIHEDAPIRLAGAAAGARRLDDTTLLIGADRAWDAGFDGTGTEVAVLDAGIQRDHPFLAGQVVAEACFSSPYVDPDYTILSLCPDGTDSQAGTGAATGCDVATYGEPCEHGTAVAGIAAGYRTSGVDGPASGVAPGADVVAIQVFSVATKGPDPDYTGCSPESPCFFVYPSDIVRALEYVYDLVTVDGRPIAAVNLSVGGGIYTATCGESDDGWMATKAAVDALLSVDVPTVLPTGNTLPAGEDAATSAPGCIATAVTVGASTNADARSVFSNVAPWMDLFAPGSSISVPIPTDAYDLVSGTSYAAPHVAGAFAILREAYPDDDVATLLERLTSTGVPIAAGDPAADYPRLQVDDALGLADAAYDLTLNDGFGWRVLAVPTDAMTAGRLAAQNLVQGTDDQYPGGQDNLFVDYPGTTWTPASDDDAPLAPGTGFAWYLFDQDIPAASWFGGGTSASVALPDGLIASGDEPTGFVEVTIHDDGDRWNLLGNPYNTALDVSGIGGWGGTATVEPTGQMWQCTPDASPTVECVGSYVLTTTTSGLVPRWQGVFFRAAVGGAGTLEIPASAAPRRAEPPRIAFQLDATDATTGLRRVDRAAVLYLAEDAAPGWDVWDAAKLAPLTYPYVALSFASTRDGAPALKAQEARPLAAFSVSLAVEAAGLGGPARLSWPTLALPAGWRATLTDRRTGTTVDLAQAADYTFEVAAVEGRRAAAMTGAVASLVSDVPARFDLQIEALGTATTAEIPSVLAFETVTPNPVAREATVGVALPAAGRVRLALHDLLGREVALLIDGDRPAGRWQVGLTTSDLAAGLYVLRLTTGAGTRTRTVTVVR